MTKGKVGAWLRKVFLDETKDAEPDPDGPDGEEADALQEEMLQGVQEFHDTVVREVMVPRTEIIAVEETGSQEEAVDLVLSSGFSRLPVYQESIDHVSGLVHAKDLLRCLKEGQSDKPLADIMREPYFIPENKPVANLLADFRNQRLHMAIVLDEYGGTAGLVTLEDLIEEIIGEVVDEYDSEVTELTALGPDELQVNARVEISDVEDYFEVELDEGKFTTVGGWILEKTGHIPGVGEEIEIGDFLLKVETGNERRVGMVRIQRRRTEDEGQVPPSPD